MLEPAETIALVRRAQRGDALAFSALVKAFLRAAYAVALAVVDRRADAEDIAQDAFVVALEKIGTCREPERFAGWLLSIVRNRALNWLSSRKLRDVTADGTVDRVGEVVAMREVGLEGRLLTALRTLSPAQREVVLLHDLEEWTHGEIAAALGLSEGMSRQHLFQARRALRARLGTDTEERLVEVES